MRTVSIPSIAAVIVAASVVVACGGDGDKSQTRTEISQVDSVIDVVASQDRDQLRDLLQFTNLPCTAEAGSLTQPQCASEPIGTTVDVFPVIECETKWLRREDVEPVLDEVMVLQPAVYAAFRSPDAFYVDGEYGVVFEGTETRVADDGLKRYMAVGVEGDNGLITGMALGCGIDEPVHFLLPHPENEFKGWLIEP